LGDECRGPHGGLRAVYAPNSPSPRGRNCRGRIVGKPAPPCRG
jgi:hypothetical protein